MYKKHRPMPNEKVDRNLELYQLKPGHSYRKLAERFGISRTRAWQVVRQLNKNPNVSVKNISGG